MRGRESGMPAVDLWETFFDAAEIVEKLSDWDNRQVCVEFGCGYGTFTLAAASLAGVQRVVSFDLDGAMVETTRNRVREAGLRNVNVIQGDFMEHGCGLEAGSANWAMIFNLLHIDEPLRLLREAYHVLAPGGILSMIHWRDDIETPRGPSLEIRPSQQQCRSWAESAGFVYESSREFISSPWHWGLKLRRENQEVGSAASIPERSRNT